MPRPRPARSAALTLALALAGCVSGGHSARYSLHVRNATDAPVWMEILCAGGGTLRRTAADIAPGGGFTTRFEVYPADAHVEARFRPSASPAGMAYLAPLRRGEGEYEIAPAAGGLSLVRVGPARPSWDAD